MGNQSSTVVSSETELKKISANLKAILNYISSGRPIPLDSQNTSALNSLNDRLALLEQALANYKTNIGQFDSRLSTLKAGVDKQIEVINALPAPGDFNALSRLIEGSAVKISTIEKQLAVPKKIKYYVFENTMNEQTNPATFRRGEVGDIDWFFYYNAVEKQSMKFISGSDLKPNIEVSFIKDPSKANNLIRFTTAQNPVHVNFEIYIYINGALSGLELIALDGDKWKVIRSTGLRIGAPTACRFDFNMEANTILEFRTSLIISPGNRHVSILNTRVIASSVV